MSLSVRIKHRLEQFELDASFEAPSGVTVLFGRSGSGKTSIINAVAGLIAPDEATISLGETVLTETSTRSFVPPHKRRLGYIFQESRLFPHLTVRRNLLYGRWFASGTERGASFDDVVDMLGLERLLDRSPASLSGGERQRVAIGRALLAKPKLILADEPLASLDEARKAEILPYFERLRDEVKIPILYVSHAAAEVARLATTVIALENGRVMQQGPAALVLSDPNVMPAGVRAAGAILDAMIVAHHADGVTELSASGEPLFLPKLARQIGTQVRIRIPAQDVLLSLERPQGLSALNLLTGIVESVRTGSGPGALVSIRTKAGPVLARITQRSAQALAIEPGVTCTAVIKSVAIAPEDIGGPHGQDVVTN